MEAMNNTRPASEATNVFAAFLAGIAAGAILLLSAMTAGVDVLGLLSKDASAEVVPAPDLNEDAWVTKVLRYQHQADPHQPDGAVIFFGDSLTQGLAVDAITDRAVNYGIAHLTADRLAAVVSRYDSVKRARAIVLMIGTNDLAQGRDPAPALRALADRIAAPLVWHAIPPRDGVEPAKANEAIRAICASRPDCTFVRTEFTPEDFTDGVHLSASGYAKLIATLQGGLVL